MSLERVAGAWAAARRARVPGHGGRVLLMWRRSPEQAERLRSEGWRWSGVATVWGLHRDQHEVDLLMERAP